MRVCLDSRSRLKFFRILITILTKISASPLINHSGKIEATISVKIVVGLNVMTKFRIAVKSRPRIIFIGCSQSRELCVSGKRTDPVFKSSSKFFLFMGGRKWTIRAICNVLMHNIKYSQHETRNFWISDLVAVKGKPDILASATSRVPTTLFSTRCLSPTQPSSSASTHVLLTSE